MARSGSLDAARALAVFEVLREPRPSQHYAKEVRSGVSLDRAGINRALLFPGLDGFAQSLRTRTVLFKRLQELEESGARTKVNVGVGYDILNEW